MADEKPAETTTETGAGGQTRTTTTGSDGSTVETTTGSNGTRVKVRGKSGDSATIFIPKEGPIVFTRP
ncbi:MAG: hypothetical protein RLZZ437_2276 [Pseudomonadota bacterium]|jgi:hypothetical protein